VAYFGFTHRFSDVERWFKEMLIKWGFSVKTEQFERSEVNLEKFTILSVTKV